VGATEDRSSSVLTPTIVVTGGVLMPAKVKASSAGPNAEFGVRNSTKSACPPGGMSTGSPGAPTRMGGFTDVSRRWNPNVASTAVASAIVTWSAGLLPALMIEAPTVTGVITCTARALGSTEATSVVGGAGGPTGWSTAIASGTLSFVMSPPIVRSGI